MLDQFSAGVDDGTGVVARWGPGVVVTGGETADARELMADLVASVGDDPTSGQLVSLFRDDHRFNHGRIDLAAAVSTPEGLRVFVRGAMEVRTETDETIAGPDPVEQDLPGANALWIGQGGPPSIQGHPVIDLRRGVVPGRGAVLYLAPTTQQPPVAPQQPAPPVLPAAPGSGPGPVGPPPLPDRPGGPPVAVGGPAEAELIDVRPFASVDWSDAAAVETRQPLPVLDDNTGDRIDDGLAEKDLGDQVLGVRCSRGHFNNPTAGYCQLCGISMVHLTHRLEPGPRPTLGFAVFADGATYALDRSYLIGRKPRPTPNGDLTALVAQDSTQSVSREHAELRVDGWDVSYVDLGSTNGSYLWQEETGTWLPLVAGEPIVLTSGSTVSVGRMTFVFQGASKSVEAG